VAKHDVNRDDVLAAIAELIEDARD